jgi:3-hydroxyisobutyrate dehydrogenase-like beta-hydroxyacid dehydrogenase
MEGDIGFVGLGQMGRRMSMRLLEAGYSLFTSVARLLESWAGIEIRSRK